MKPILSLRRAEPPLRLRWFTPGLALSRLAPMFISSFPFGCPPVAVRATPRWTLVFRL